MSKRDSIPRLKLMRRDHASTLTGDSSTSQEQASTGIQSTQQSEGVSTMGAVIPIDTTRSLMSTKYPPWVVKQCVEVYKPFVGGLGKTIEYAPETTPEDLERVEAARKAEAYADLVAKVQAVMRGTGR